MTLTGKKYTEREIIEDVIKYIISHRLPVDTKLASSEMMAERYNVSAMTVNRAITKLAKRGIVYRRSGSGTFVGKVVPGKSHIKVKIFNWQYSKSDPLAIAAYGTFYNALLKGLEHFGFQVSTSEKQPFHDKIFTGEHVEKFDLLIVPGGMVNCQTVPLLKKLKTPIVMINNEKLSPWPFHQVFHDYVPGFEKALSYIKKIGYSKIFIAGMAGETSEFRSEQLLQCARQEKMQCEILPFMSGIYSNQPHVAYLSGQEHGKYCIEHKLEGIVFTLSDFIAFGIVDILSEHNVKIGNKLKLVSYDNIESRRSYSKEPVLTSITHPLEQMAEHVVELVEYIVNHKIECEESNYIIRVPASELVIRSSA
ncbi:MAG: substrate-binding domain-containing protein [Victivallaceae bacterium]